MQGRGPEECCSGLLEMRLPLGKEEARIWGESSGEESCALWPEIVFYVWSGAGRLSPRLGKELAPERISGHHILPGHSLVVTCQVVQRVCLWERWPVLSPTPYLAMDCNTLWVQSQFEEHTLNSTTLKKLAHMHKNIYKQLQHITMVRN